MICPKCSAIQTRAINTVQSGGVTKRIRKCRKCDYAFNTIERPEIITFSEDEKIEYENYIEE